MSVTRAKYFQVLVGDSNSIDVPKAKDSNGKEPEANTVVSDSEDEAFVEDTPLWESTAKPIRLLFNHYKQKGVVVNIDHEDKPQSIYVNLSDADAFLADVKYKGYGSEDHHKILLSINQ